MAKKKQIKYVISLILLCFFEMGLISAQNKYPEVEMLLNDTIVCKAIVLSKYESIDVLVNHVKNLRTTYWPNGCLGSVIVKTNDTSFIQLGFNYVGKIISQSEYKIENDSLIAYGLHYHYSDDGYLNHIYSYKNGELDGTYKSFYKSGILKSAGRYDKNKKKGTWIFYSEDGVIIKKEKF